jgi:cholesterol oxidase
VSAVQLLHVIPRARPGVQFTERMTGELTWALGDGLEPTSATLTLCLTVKFDDLETTLQRASHPGWFVGSAEAPILSDQSMAVTGRFNLLVVDPARVDQRRLRYRGRMTTCTREDYSFRGYKTIVGDRGLRLWRDFTSLPITVRRRGREVGRGVLRLSAADVLRELTTLRALGAENLAEKLDTLVRFLAFFAGAVRDASGGVLGTTRVIVRDATRRRSPRAVAPPSDPECYEEQVGDGARIRLHRYRGGGRGPVILAPGFGVKASSFLTQTVDDNLVAFLCRREYDVWLLDYRASPEFLDPIGPDAKATAEFTIDDIARFDWPTAIDKVCAVTEREQVQVVVHCVGSLSFLMAMLCDAPPGPGAPGRRAPGELYKRIRSAVCSQLGLHPITRPFNELKAWSYLAPILRLAGRKTLDADFDEHSWIHWLLDRALRIYSTPERCSNPACRRILLLFGESFKHSQLNVATHDAIQEWFGRTSVRALVHLSRMLRARHAVNADGEDVYRETLRREPWRLSFPIAFMHGKDNREFVPRATAETLALLCERRRGGPYTREVFPGWGHMDFFVGRCATPIFSWIADQLDNPDGAGTPAVDRPGSAPR